MTTTYPFARRVAAMRPSEVREFLRAAENPDLISFAGGFPAPELFPLEAIKRSNAMVLEEEGQLALQYASTEGFLPLRRWVAKRLERTQGVRWSEHDILLTGGSQQALDLTGKVFLDEGDVVLCESPTYLSALSAFQAYGCAFAEVPTDDDGMVIWELEAILKRTQRVKIIYVIPNFQNPTGRTWSLQRRQQLAEIAPRHGVVVIEDNPYGELRFEGESLPSVQSFDKSGCVFQLGTFSKIFCPGYRIGWIAGNQSVIEKYALAKQSADLQCNTLAQREIAKYLECYDIDEHIPLIRAAYLRRRNLAIRMLETEFPKDIRFTRPQGGLFLWVELPERINARDLLKAAMAQNVIFVPGGSFFPNRPRENTLRINFSNMPEDRIETGMKRLARVLREQYYR